MYGVCRILTSIILKAKYIPIAKMKYIINRLLRVHARADAPKLGLYKRGLITDSEKQVGIYNDFL